MSGKLEGYIWMPAHRAGKRGEFKQAPVALVAHSGWRAAHVAEWFQRRIARNWTTFAWTKGHGCIAQCDLINQTTQHAGRFWNDFSIGVELPGPWRQNPRPQEQADELIRVARDCVAIYPSIVLATTHRSITKSKRDPGPGFRPEWLAEVLQHVRVL